MMTRSVLETLDAVRDHMTVFELPEPYSVYVGSIPGRAGEYVSIHVHLRIDLATVASALVRWGDTLTTVRAGIWQPPTGHVPHLEVVGGLTGGTIVQVWGGAQLNDADVAVEPGHRTVLTFGVLRAWAEVSA